MIRANRYRTPGSLGMPRGILGRQGRCTVDHVRLVMIVHEPDAQDDELDTTYDESDRGYEYFPLVMEWTRNGPADHMPHDPHPWISGTCDCALPKLGEDDLFRPATGYWVARRDKHDQE